MPPRSAKSDCCEKEQHPEICDRAIILGCISTWFGSVENFEASVKTELRSALADQLTNNTFSYQCLAQVALPVMCALMDRSANHAAAEMPSCLVYQLVDLTRAFTYVLTVFPFIGRLIFRITFQFRAKRRDCFSEILLSLSLLLVGVAVFAVISALEEGICFGFALERFPNTPEAPLYASFAILGAFGLVTFFFWRYIPTSPGLLSTGASPSRL